MKGDSICRNDNFPVLISLALALGIIVGAVAVLSMSTFVGGKKKETVVSVSPP